MKRMYVVIAAISVLALTSVCYAANWQYLKTITGAADQTTNYFTIPTGEWRITWSITPKQGASDFAIFGAFIYPKGENVIYVNSINGDKSQTSGITYIHEGNKEYYLKILAANLESYSLKIEYDTEATGIIAPGDSTNSGDSNYLLTVFSVAIIFFIITAIPTILYFRRHKAQQQQSTNTLKDPKT